MARKFKIRDGKHIHGSRTFNKDEVVISDLDLVRLFPCKFDMIGEATPAEEKEFNALIAPKKKRVKGEPVLVTSDKGKKGKDDWE